MKRFFCLALGLLACAGCSRSEKPVTDTDTPVETEVTTFETTMVGAHEEETAETWRWDVPRREILATNEVSLTDIDGVIAEARAAGVAVTDSEDTEALGAARDQILEAEASIYGLAVRMREVWTKEEYQFFLRRISYSDLVNMRQDVDRRIVAIDATNRLWGIEP